LKNDEVFNGVNVGKDGIGSIGALKHSGDMAELDQGVAASIVKTESLFSTQQAERGKT